MSIVSQRIIEDYTNGQGQRKLRMLFTDHLGEEHEFTEIIDLGADAYTFLTGFVSTAEEKLAKIELRNVVGRVKRGESLEDIYDSRKHSERGDLRAKILEVVGEFETKVAEDQLVVDQKSVAELFNGKI